MKRFSISYSAILGKYLNILSFYKFTLSRKSWWYKWKKRIVISNRFCDCNSYVFQKGNFRNHIMLTFDIICILTFLLEVFLRLYRLLMIFKGYFDLCYCLCLFVYFSINVSGTSLLFWCESWEYNAIVFWQISETQEHYIWQFRQIRGLLKIRVKW